MYVCMYGMYVMYVMYVCMYVCMATGVTPDSFHAPGLRPRDTKGEGPSSWGLLVLVVPKRTARPPFRAFEACGCARRARGDAGGWPRGVPFRPTELSRRGLRCDGWAQGWS